MIGKIFCVIVLLSIPQNLISGEDALDKITSWQDVKKFSGYVVAFKTSSCYIGRQKYAKCGINDIFEYGFIFEKTYKWDGGEIGYPMARLLKRGSFRTNCALIDSVIQECELSMRFATAEELLSIKDKIKSYEVEFEDHSDNLSDIFNALSNQIKLFECD